ncbi:hypothetical protein PAXRUDRAFT_13706 [Paxillus rubicundulus Ve08.2h10]|uniref:Unplaced genomic scaffold scaffold_548, whole genome shotgun sequence n=1 Tax=Paxillus rubicundulus Ve08.2h10 TaxID=930991 RepID=A0A0D0DYC4_9AGAM|nr:hypothetical protein PAXRUDRAFT_13706 [Paxillus rubicundulus Ve08.2h10]
MNSPDPGSPISTDTSGSPPPDDFQFTNRDQQHMLNIANAQFPSNISSSFTPNASSSKRRLPGGSTSEGPLRRDPKSRRREEAMGTATGSKRIIIEGQGPHIVSSSVGPTSFQSRGDYGSRRDKEELVDIPLVEQLRQDFGDPFLDSGLKQLS